LEAAVIEHWRREEALFRKHGIEPPPGTMIERRTDLERQLRNGALMVVGSDKIIESEKARVRADFQASGGRGMSAADKAERLATMAARMRRLQAQHARELRQREARGEVVEYDVTEPEMFLRTDRALELIAAGKEPTDGAA
jgi:hypothetical protein